MIRRVTAPGLLPPPTHSHASVVEAGTKPAFLAGSVPLDARGELVGAGDPVRQAEQVIADLAEQPQAVGSNFAHVLSTDVYVVATEPAVLGAVWTVVEASGLSAGPHASTLLGVACLGYPGQLVEITATAAVPRRTRERVSAESAVPCRAVGPDARAAADVRLRSFAAAPPAVVRPHSDDAVRAWFEKREPDVRYVWRP